MTHEPVRLADQGTREAAQGREATEGRAARGCAFGTHRGLGRVRGGDSAALSHGPASPQAHHSRIETRGEIRANDIGSPLLPSPLNTIPKLGYQLLARA